MIAGIELKKLKRTGYFPAFLAGSAVSSAFPVLNMTVRAELFTGAPGSPIDILLNANWQMMTMLNILLIVCVACMMYHIEYTENGIQKMETLPVRLFRLFAEKFLITAAASAMMLFIEFAVLTACIFHWFPDASLDFKEIIQNCGFEVLLMLPTIILSLLIASVCRNMWSSLGIEIILVFTLSIFPQNQLFFALCPYCSPYQLSASADALGHTDLLLIFCTVETVLIGSIEFIYLKIRRYFS